MDSSIPLKRTLSQQLERLRSKSQSLKRDLALTNQKTAYIAESVDTFATGLTSIANVGSTGDDDLDATLNGALEVGALLEDRLDRLTFDVSALSRTVDDSLPLFSTSSSSVVATCNSLSIGASTLAYRPCPFLNDSDETAYAMRLADADESLGRTYRSAWNAFYAEPHDPGRTALWEMRQTYDHFFTILAPDADVRNSPYWSRKTGDKPDSVHRGERLRYAANRWVRDPTKRQVLLSSVEDTARAYQRLNTAHERGPIAEDNARQVFLAVDSIIRRWIDSIAHWPPQ